MSRVARKLVHGIARWNARWNRREGAEPLALVRIFVGLVIAWDLLEVLRFGLVEPLWAPIEEGGMGPARYAEPLIFFYEWFGASAGNAWLLFGTACVAASCLSLGIFSRVSALLLLVVYAQLEKLSPDADRGIDTLLRNVLLILAYAPADATFSLAAWLRDGRFDTRAEISAWPRYLIVAQLTLLYFCAGVLKQSADWSYGGDYRALFAVLQQPHYVRWELPRAWLVALYPWIRAGAFATVFWERAALCLPLLLWLRGTALRGGWLRTWVNRARLLELWVGLGVTFHLSLALVLALGIFPWGCLALYPALAAPTTLRRAGAWLASRVVRSPAGGSLRQRLSSSAIRE